VHHGLHCSESHRPACGALRPKGGKLVQQAEPRVREQHDGGHPPVAVRPRQATQQLEQHDVEGDDTEEGPAAQCTRRYTNSPKQLEAQTTKCWLLVL